MAKLFANNRDPDETPNSVASDLGLHCFFFCFFFQLPFLGYPD